MLAARRYVSLIFLAVLAGCSADSPLAPDPDPLPALQSAVWHVNVSDGQALPALLGHRIVNGNVLEQDFLDSAQFVVNANGSWEQLGWYQRYRNGEPYHLVASLDWGSWVATPDAYEFRRNTGELLYVVGSAPAAGLWQLNLRYPNQEGLAVSQLRSTRPPLSVAGRYRAAEMNNQPLPYAYVVDPAFDNGTEIVAAYVFVDSAFVSVQTNGRYRHTVYYSQWEGPVGGTPQVRTFQLRHNDFGAWRQEGPAITLESGWLQNHLIRGERVASGDAPLVLNHGISHGDPTLPLRYLRY